MSTAGAPGRRPLAATYRLQLRAEFTFDDAAAVVPHVAALGATHLYLSPILQAAPGSAHGYDVVDHSRLSADLGGREGFMRLVAAARAAGLGIVVDVVPNHVAIPTPAWRNPVLWKVLREGPAVPEAGWFDVDWSAEDRAILMPILGEPIGRCLREGTIALDRSGDEPLVRYFDHVLPVRPGTDHLPLPELLDRQWYRLAHWKVADEELNYRRFFDVDTLAGIRMERPEVFEATHRVLLDLHAEGAIDGFRIDHPDGLADPRGYLRRLREATGGAWVVVEKILEGDERLPADWDCDGTTGYDALNRVMAVLVDVAGAEPLTAVWTGLAGGPRTFHEVAEEAKREVLAGPLRAEVNRLVALVAAICQDDIMLRDHTRRAIEEALVELLVAFPVYRAYVVPGEAPSAEAAGWVEGAAAAARERLPERAEEVDLLADLALGRRGRGPMRDEFCVRFQQTCGPVMAKGVEDTAFYRYFRLAALNEVGGEPGVLGIPADALHAWAEARQSTHPRGMTSLTTHDTKRSEDVRARLVALAEIGEEWAAEARALHEATAPLRTAEGRPHPADELLLWQTLVGAWPIDAERLVPYLQKAVREGKLRSSWTSPDEAYEAALQAVAEGVLADEALRRRVAALVERLAPATRANVLSQKLLQMVLPGVADVYQGTELVTLSLVDPDNRRPVDYDERRARLARLDGGGAPADLDDEKLLVTSRALRLRREHPGWFAGPEAGYAALPAGSVHAVGVLRAGRVAAVATRLPIGLERAGGWGSATVALPEGRWRDALGERTLDGGLLPVAEVLGRLPVALLVREGG
ncbi:malto-oligosyltrehalose synthase [Miltoncostaea marina]|uniref:malto-oligosyltrehalose synthase n=1 Tax=Miltoncostaea marina TaxID=2843215 RepID=UPI001C3D3AF3|nr:malto-oligosyltrehalose synthase [Miltoncostaea marina]